MIHALMMPRRIFYLLWSVCLGLLLAACQNSQTTTLRSHVESFDLSGFVNQEQWVENLKLRLRVSYRQDPEGASFGFVPRDALAQPSLYATHAVVGIHSALEQPIQNRALIRSWLLSLMGENGAYDDKQTKSSHLLKTFWAVETLRYLGEKPEQPAKTISFIRSLQGADGLFHEDTVGTDSTWKQKLEATHYALQILRVLGVDLKRADYLEPTAQTLRQYLQTQLAESPNGSIPPSDSPVVAVMGDLALIDPQFVDAAARAVLEQNFALLELSKNLTSQMLVLAYLDTGDALGMQFSDNQLQRLRLALEATMAPELNRYTGMTAEGQIIEPALTLISVRLFKRLAVPYPNASELQKNLAKYRIPEGWIMFVIPTSDAGITYHSLVIADAVGYTDFNADKVAQYLQNVIRNPAASENLQSAAYAVQALNLLGQKPDKASLQTIKRKAQNKIIAAKSRERFAMLVHLAWFIRAANDEWPSALQELAHQTLQELDPGTNLNNAEAIYNIALLQAISHRQILSPQQLKSNLLELLTPDGGFKAASTAPTADLASTLLALHVLTMLGDTSGIEPYKIRQFVISTQDDYGFTYVPRTALQREPFKGTNLNNTLATHLGFEILKMVQDGVKPSKYGLP